MAWEQWPGGALWKSRWEELVKADRLPVAFLWVGPEGVGKTPIAITLTQTLLCTEGDGVLPCGQCGACAAMLTLSHPHLFLLPPLGGGKPLEEALVLFRERLSKDPFLSLVEWEEVLLGGKGTLSIGVEAVRKLQSWLTLAVPDRRWRVVLFWQAQLLTRQAANALLKVVEEPPEKTLFLFLSTRLEALPATLRSRCVVWRFPPLSAQQLQALAGQPPSAPLLTMAEGRYSRLKRLLAPEQEPYVQALRDWLRGLFRLEDPSRLRAAIETLLTAPRLPELLLMGISLVRAHPELSLAQKTWTIEALLHLADELEAHLNPPLLLWEATLRLQARLRESHPTLEGLLHEAVF